MSDEPVVSFRNVSFAYDRVSVLRDVNFSVGAREAICIVGPNGGGKTTLAKLILGLIRPAAGQVRVFGRRPDESRLRVGYMPQYLRYDPLFPVSVMDIVLTGRLGKGRLGKGRLGKGHLGKPSLRGWLGWHGPDDKQVAHDALARVGMGDFARRPLSSLSGGERQRVLIARALCCRPDLLLLDEPTANLDTPTGTRLFEILQTLHRRMAIIIISHDVGFVTHLAQNVVCVNREVVVHPVEELDGRAIHDLYQGDVRMVQHSDRIEQMEGGNE